MHCCPECEMECDCDGLDLWLEDYPLCFHDCEEDDDGEE